MLITILSRRGSVPRKEGAHLLLKGDGTRMGTIGGGGLEAEALRLARECLHSKTGYLQSFTLVEGDDPSDMVCGGNVTVYIEPVTLEDASIYTFVTEALNVSLPCCLIRLLSRRGEGTPRMAQGPRGATRADGKFLFSTSMGEKTEHQRLTWAQVLLKDGEETIRILSPEILGFSSKFPWDMVVFEILHTFSRLVIFGGGHLSKALCTMASLCRFHVEVFDDRAEFANKTRFPEATRAFHIPNYQEIPTLVGLDPHSFVVIATRGHRFDEIVLSQVISHDLPYIGMVGSRQKNAIVFERLRDQGVSPTALDHVHAPIGLSIGSETPEEIAVSILAELIQVRAQRKKKVGKHP